MITVIIFIAINSVRRCCDYYKMIFTLTIEIIYSKHVIFCIFFFLFSAFAQATVIKVGNDIRRMRASKESPSLVVVGGKVSALIALRSIAKIIVIIMSWHKV
jgi:hypothetical protein